MKLSKFKEDSYYFSGKVSDLTRQLSFAGIALIWILKKDSLNAGLEIPLKLIQPLLFFALSLSFDFLQYLYSTIVWTLFHLHHENKLEIKTSDPDLTAPSYLNWPSWLFFIFKVIFILFAYFSVINYFFSLVYN